MINSYLKEWHDRPICEITRGEIKELLRVKARTAPGHGESTAVAYHEDF